MTAAHCPSCGRRHEPRHCTDTPKGADAWKRVLAASKSATPPLTDTTAGA